MSASVAELVAPPVEAVALVGDVEQFLQTAMSSLAPLAPTAPMAGRPRVLPSLCLWAGVLVCLLRGATTQNAVWRLLTRTGLWHYPRLALSDEAIYRRLARESAPPDGQQTLLAQLFSHITSLLRQRLAPYADTTLAPFAREVLAVDETTLDQVGRYLPALRQVPARDGQLLPGKLAAVFDLRRQVWQHVQHVAYAHQNEKRTAPSLLPCLARGALLVMDLGYFSFAWFDTLTDAGYFWISRLRDKTSYEVIHVFYQQDETLDALIWLGAYRADRCRHRVRLVQFRLGPTLYRYVTNVEDPSVFPLREIARVYQRRWDIECAFQLVKQHLQLRQLWSSKPAVVLQQVWGVLIISQIVQALRVEIAARAGVEVFDVSLALLVDYVPQYLAEGTDPVAAFVADGRRLGFIRPSSRTANQAPTIWPHQITPAPPDLVPDRRPRYAQRKCGPRDKLPAHALD